MLHMPGMPALGSELTKVITVFKNHKSASIDSPKISQRNTSMSIGYGDSSSCHKLTPTSSTQLIGTRYFRHVIMTWSMRSRGNVQRTHIMMNTRNQHLKMKTMTLMVLPKPMPQSIIVFWVTCHCSQEM